MKKIFLLIAFLHGTNVFSQISVTHMVNPLQLVNDIVGPGVTISNVSFTGDTIMAGTFTSTGTNLGMSAGIVLCTGPVDSVIGPNQYPNSGIDLLLPGDSLLSIIATGSTHDAAILEFDVVPEGDTLYFSYVFTSEEYPEYVCSIYNDVFTLDLSGPGISGTLNMAQIPGTSYPVSINNVNGGIIGSNGTAGSHCNLLYSSLYVDNTSGLWLEADGFTAVMTSAVFVTPGAMHHLRIAIADVGDGNYDSAIFFQAEGLSTGISSTIPKSLLLFPDPDASDGEIKFNRNLENATVMVFDITGKLVDSFLNFNNSTLNTRYSKGWYVIHLNEKGKDYSFKAIVQ
jgi:hypothetical protein